MLPARYNVNQINLILCTARCDMDTAGSAQLVAVRGSTVRRAGTRRRHTFRLHGHLRARSETA